MKHKSELNSSFYLGTAKPTATQCEHRKLNSNTMLGLLDIDMYGENDSCMFKSTNSGNIHIMLINTGEIITFNFKYQSNPRACLKL